MATDARQHLIYYHEVLGEDLGPLELISQDIFDDMGFEVLQPEQVWRQADHLQKNF